MIECHETEYQTRRKTNGIFKSNLVMSRNLQLGCQNTWSRFIGASTPGREREALPGGEATVNHSNIRDVLEQLWTALPLGHLE